MSRRYFDSGSLNRGTDTSPRKSDISFRRVGVCDKNIKKSVVQPCQNLEFLGVEINSKDMVLVIPEGKKKKIVEQCQFLLKKPLLTMKNLKSGDMPVSLNSHCSSASTSTVSSNATPENNGVFHGEKLRFKNKLIKGV